VYYAAKYWEAHPSAEQDFFNLLLKGVVSIPIGKSFRLKDIKEAVIEAERPARGGKVILLP